MRVTKSFVIQNIIITMFLKGFLLILMPIILFSASAELSFAQMSETNGAIVVQVSPANPRPNQIVSLHAESYRIDLDRASDIVWLHNGRIIARGAGVRDAQFIIGPLGSQSIIDITINALGGVVFSKRLILRPTEVDIIWEANTFTPPFYTGKALPSSDARITITAMSHFVNSVGRTLKSNELIYKWKRDGKTLGSLSGRGKDNIVVTGPKLLHTTIISVNVSSIDSVLSGKRSTVISSVKPKIVFYENDPVVGIKYENAVHKNFTLVNEEVTITAHPYFFSLKDRIGSDIKYEWRVNNLRVEGLSGDESSITLRQVSGQEGSATVGLSIKNINRLLQFAKNNFQIAFSLGVSQRGLFGF